MVNVGRYTSPMDPKGNDRRFGITSQNWCNIKTQLKATALPLPSPAFRVSVQKLHFPIAVEFFIGNKLGVAPAIPRP